MNYSKFISINFNLYCTVNFSESDIGLYCTVLLVLLCFIFSQNYAVEDTSEKVKEIKAIEEEREVNAVWNLYLSYFSIHLYSLNM